MGYLSVLQFCNTFLTSWCNIIYTLLTLDLEYLNTKSAQKKAPKKCPKSCNLATQLRLDFDSFIIHGPSTDTTATGFG